MGRVLALDPGSTRIGVALSDALQLTAQPHSTLDATADDLIPQIRALVGDNDVEVVVVGLPVSLDGSSGQAATAARQFAGLVADEIGVPVELVDERFSSVIAERVMLEAGTKRRKRREGRDRVAAAVILQAYLDRVR